MECVFTNSSASTAQVPASVQRLFANGNEVKMEFSNNNSPFSGATFSSPYRFRTEDFVGFELTMVPEVECVFVEKEEDCSFRVFTIVNERDFDVRSKVYDREIAILEAHPGLEFEFNVISRRNRPLEKVFKSTQKPYRHSKA